MKTSPDVLGYNIEDAIDLLKGYNLKWVIIESIGKNSKNLTRGKVIQTKQLPNKTFELIISYF